MDILTHSASDVIKAAVGTPLPTTSSSMDQIRDNMKAKAVASLFFFSTAVLNWDKIRKTPHLDLCNYIQRVNAGNIEDGRKKGARKVLLVPRDCYKSTIASKSLPLWILTQPDFCGLPGPEHRILLASHSSENAKKQVRSLRQQVERNTVFQWLFPELTPDFQKTTWTDNALLFPREGMYGENTIEIAGIDTHVVSRHFTTIICDDLEDQASFESPTVRERVKNWYKASEALFVDEVSAYHLMIGTRWGIDDVYADIQKNESDTYEFYVRPLYWNRDTLESDQREATARMKPSIYNMDPELFAPDAGKTYYFFPELFNADSAKRIRQKQGQMMFSMLYLNNPKDASLTEFKKEDFRFCEWSSTGNILFVNEEGHREEAILENLFRVMFWDPALSEEKQKKGCRNAIVVAMYDKKSHNLFFVEGFAVKNEPTSLCNRFIGFHQRYVISVAAVEDVGFQRTLLYPLRHQMFEMGNSFPVKLVPQVRSKDMRIRSLIPYFESHKVFINRRATDLIDEFEGYPMFPTKDLVDAAASCLELVHGTASQSQSIDEHTLARLRRQERDRMSQRNATTGY